MKGKYYITICGNIGTGKTTLTKLLTDELDWRPYLEIVDDFVYLKDFHTDMKRWSFHNQLNFLLRKFKQQQEISEDSSSAIQDVGPYECYEVFTKALFCQNLLDERDLICIEEIFNLFSKYLPKPDLIIYLESTVPTIVNRIGKRGRFYEKTIPVTLIEEIERRYTDWIKKITVCPLIKFNTEHLNFHNKNDLKFIITVILKFCKN